MKKMLLLRLNKRNRTKSETNHEGKENLMVEKKVNVVNVVNVVNEVNEVNAVSAGNVVNAGNKVEEVLPRSVVGDQIVAEDEGAEEIIGKKKKILMPVLHLLLPKKYQHQSLRFTNTILL